MIVNQISVKLANRPGELSKISDIMGDEGINIKALTASVHGDNAQIHMVPDNPAKAEEILKGRGYELHVHRVIAVETPDHPGGLNAVLRPLKEAGINIEFLYPVIGRSQKNAVLIVGGEPIEEAVKALSRHYIKILDKELYAL
ncbi:MAG TPA: ACT domain-containing protein [bacterium]|nr:ACT domain-containing protein [bacterium]